MPKDLSRFEGVVVNNEDVAGYHRKHGACAFSKPHGPNKTILYYPNPEGIKAADAEAAGVEVEDFAGRETPATRDMVVQGSPQGSTLVSRVVRAGAHPQAVAFDDNPNRDIADAPIHNEGDLDDDVLDAEEQYHEKITTEIDPEAMGRPAPSLGEAVRRIDQEKVSTDISEVELAVDARRNAEPTYEPVVPDSKKAVGDTSKSPKKAAAKKATKKAAKKGKRR